MTEERIYIEKMKLLLEKYSDFSPLLPETRLKEDLCLDSIQVIQLIMEVEDTFKVTMSDEQVVRLYTVADIITFLEKERNGVPHD